MSPLAPRDRHLDLRTVLDYLDGHSDAAARRAVDEHLARPCADCRERVRQTGELLETMRLDTSLEVPAALHALARGAFEPLVRPGPAVRLVEALARLVFDSLATPLPAAARRSVGEARRLRFQLGETSLDLELEPEGGATQSLCGRLETQDPALWRLVVRSGGERFDVRPDAGGAFALANLPAGALEVSVEGPGVLFRLPTIAG